MYVGEEVGEVRPAGWAVEFGVGSCGGAVGWEGEEAAGLGDLFGVCVPVGDEVFLGVVDGVHGAGGTGGADDFDVLLESEHKF